MDRGTLWVSVQHADRCVPCLPHPQSKLRLIILLTRGRIPKLKVQVKILCVIQLHQVIDLLIMNLESPEYLPCFLSNDITINFSIKCNYLLPLNLNSHLTNLNFPLHPILSQGNTSSLALPDER